MRLNGKIAVITGGGTGIGRGTAILFAKEGAKVMIAGRRKEPLKETAEAIKSNGGSADYIVTDISKSEQVKKLFEETEKNTAGLTFYSTMQLCSQATAMTFLNWKKMTGMN